MTEQCKPISAEEARALYPIDIEAYRSQIFSAIRNAAAQGKTVIMFPEELTEEYGARSSDGYIATRQAAAPLVEELNALGYKLVPNRKYQDTLKKYLAYITIEWRSGPQGLSRPD